jgi:hypothetical protein
MPGRRRRGVLQTLRRSWLGRREQGAGDEALQKKGGFEEAGQEVDLRAYVERLELTELVALVMEQADADWRLRERLTARAMAERGSGIDERAWRRRLDAVFGPQGRYVDYREAATWAGDVSDVIEALAEQADAGHAAAVISLAEHAHRLADAAVGYVDDSDGYLADISARIGEVHRRACEIAGPDPIPLAGRLVDLELTSELDAFHRAAVTYATVLGKEGLAEYQRLIEPKWQALAKKKGAGSLDGFRVREAMRSGPTVEEVEAVEDNDVDSPFHRLARYAEAVGPAVQTPAAARLRERPMATLAWERAGLGAPRARRGTPA